MEKCKVDKKCRQLLEDLRYAIEINENVEISKNDAEKFISLNNSCIIALDYDTYEDYNSKLNDLLLSIQTKENHVEEVSVQVKKFDVVKKHLVIGCATVLFDRILVCSNTVLFLKGEESVFLINKVQLKDNLRLFGSLDSLIKNNIISWKIVDLNQLNSY